MGDLQKLAVLVTQVQKLEACWILEPERLNVLSARFVYQPPIQIGG